MTDYQVPDPRRIGAVLREVRHRRGLTQAELAEKASVSRGWLVKLEQGHATPEVEPVFRVLSALDLSMVLADTERTSEQLAAERALARVLGERDD